MKKIFVLGFVAFATGCVSNKALLVDYGAQDTQEIQKVAPIAGYQALEQADSCCDSLSEINYQTISHTGKFDFIIDTSSATFQFSTGKSFVKGIQLPKADGTIKIAISAPIISSVFIPSLLVLDAQYQPLKIYSKETIYYDNASLLSMDRFFGHIEIPELYGNGRQAKYLLIFTTEEAMQSTTILALPNASAVQSGRSDVAYKRYMEKSIEHTAIGSVRLAFDYKLNSSNAAKEIITAVAVTTTDTINPIQPETEAMFLKLIEQAVIDGKYNKAEHFAEEAKKAGSRKAKDALDRALEKYKE